MSLFLTLHLYTFFRAEERLQSSSKVKERQKVDKQTPQNRPINLHVLVSSRAELISGPNVKKS